jgi:hypothetical protein
MAVATEGVAGDESAWESNAGPHPEINKQASGQEYLMDIPGQHINQRGKGILKSNSWVLPFLSPNSCLSSFANVEEQDHHGVFAGEGEEGLRFGQVLTMM